MECIQRAVISDNEDLMETEVLFFMMEYKRGKWKMCLLLLGNQAKCQAALTQILSSQDFTYQDIWDIGATNS